ncbi:hypothetical protein [Nostoc sp.]|uniref:hypothetical protein n=1 Tax=Nostoc sp. TaxID=1180 RepID=UPI002FF70D38
MLDFWRLDAVDDFFLVAAPTLATATTIRAYHLELLSRVRSLSHHHLIESDAVLFPNFAQYYQKLGDRLSPNFDTSKIQRESRHSFFIAAEPRGNFWISGLELLMGFDYEEGRGKREEGKSKGSSLLPSSSLLLPSTGDFNLDVLAELLMLPNSAPIQWLAQERSPAQLAALTKQVGDRLRGQVAIDELQRERDLQLFEQQQGVEQLKKAGFSL